MIHAAGSMLSLMRKSMERSGICGLRVAISATLLNGFVPAAGSFELVGWDWSFQKQPIEGRFVFCKTNAPEGASQTIRNAAAKCAIRFNSAKRWYVGSGAPSNTQNDLFSVALHEFGHCVGLADVQTSGAVMSGTLLPGQTARDLKPDDIAGRNKIYGAP
jgi:hypothetical protein